MSLEDLDFDKELAEYGLGAGGDFDGTVQMGEEKNMQLCHIVSDQRRTPFLTRVLDIRMDCVVWSTLQVTMVEKPHEPTCPCCKHEHTHTSNHEKEKKIHSHRTPAKRSVSWQQSDMITFGKQCIFFWKEQEKVK